MGHFKDIAINIQICRLWIPGDSYRVIRVTKHVSGILNWNSNRFLSYNYCIFFLDWQTTPHTTWHTLQITYYVSTNNYKNIFRRNIEGSLAKLGHYIVGCGKAARFSLVLYNYLFYCNCYFTFSTEILLFSHVVTDLKNFKFQNYWENQYIML